MESARRRCSSTAHCRSSSTLRAVTMRSRLMCVTRFTSLREAKAGSSTADDGFASAADFDHRLVAGELARLKRAGAGKVDALALDLAGDIGLDGTRTVEPQCRRLQIADLERARAREIQPQLAGFEAVGRHD